MSILLLDDHTLFLEGMAMLLRERLPAAGIFQARTVESALTCPGNAIRLVLMDFYIADADGLAGLGRLRKTHPQVPIVIVSASHDIALINEALRSGANGFVHKSASMEQLLAAIQEVWNGRECYVPDESHPAARAVAHRLTPRQREVLAQLCLGKSNKEIGRSLNLSENTVRIHLGEVFRVLDVNSRSEAIVLARGEVLFDRKRDLPKHEKSFFLEDGPETTT